MVVLMAVLAAACTAGPTPLDESVAGAEDTFDGDPDELVPVEPFELVTKTAADDPRRFEASRILAEAWQDAGIPVELVPLANAELTRRTFSTKDYDTYLIEYSPTSARLDPSDFMGRFWSGNAQDDGNNVSGYTNPEYDSLYEAQFGATSEDERLETVRQAQALLHRDQPVALILHPFYAGPFNTADWSGAVNAAAGPASNFWSSLRITPQGERRTLVIGAVTEAESLNPVSATLLEEQFPLSHMYDTLVRVGPEAESVPWAAESITVEGATVRATLRSGMTFHDGEPVTAEDVRFTFEYLREHEAPLFAARLEQIESVEIDGADIIFQLAQPSAAFEVTVLAEVPILPKHLWEDLADPQGFANDEPIGSGPFMFESRRRGGELRMAANPEHFDPPQADGLVLSIFGTRDAAIGALETGEVDLLSGPLNMPQAEQLRSSSRVEILEAAGHGWVGIHYNLRRAPFDDVAFRRALSYLTPSQDIIDIVYDGSGELAASIMAPNLKWHNPDLEPFRYDPERARAELDDAGYVFHNGTLHYPPDQGS